MNRIHVFHQNIQFVLTKSTKLSDSERIALYGYITTICSRYGILVLVILGTIGNTLNICVFGQKKLRNNACTLYLFTGACIDLFLTLTIALPRMLVTYNLDYSAIIGILCKMRHFAYFTFSSLSVWMIALATFDRYLISSPSATVRSKSSYRTASRLMTGSIIILILIFGDLFYCADVVTKGVITSCSSSTSKPCGFYNQIARLITVLCIPETAILVCGIGIARNLKFLKRIRSESLQDISQNYNIGKADRELIKLVVGQIVMLTISWLPLGVHRIYALVTYDSPKTALQKAEESLSDEITSIVARFNNSLSFYVYLLIGGAFYRKSIANAFCGLVTKHRVQPTGVTFHMTRLVPH